MKSLVSPFDLENPVEAVLVRYCHGCGTITEIDNNKRCCPDSQMQERVPRCEAEAKREAFTAKLLAWEKGREQAIRLGQKITFDRGVAYINKDAV